LNKVIRSRHFRSLISGALLLLAVHVVGTLGYRYLGRPLATHEGDHWVFNPADDHVVRAGAALVLMTTPHGRAQVEQLIKA
jgi:hypothetical protein